MKRLLQTPQAQAVMARLGAWYLDATLHSKRWTLDGMEHLARHRAGAPAIIAFWHETLPLMPALLDKSRTMADYRPVPVHILVSLHRDGRFIGDLMRYFRMNPVLGSSSKGGASALRSLISLLNGGEIIAITPDGPRGPVRQAAPGVAQLAALTGVPVIPCGGATDRGRRLNTWDRMIAPLPFGRAALSCRPPIIVDRSDWQGAVPLITRELNLACEQAERLCTA